MNSMVLAPPTSRPSTVEYDIVISNGRVIDGSGRPGYLADVAIKGDRIVRIGKLGQAQATRMIWPD